MAWSIRQGQVHLKSCQQLYAVITQLIVVPMPMLSMSAGEAGLVGPTGLVDRQGQQ